MLNYEDPLLLCELGFVRCEGDREGWSSVKSVQACDTMTPLTEAISSPALGRSWRNSILSLLNLPRQV